MINLIKKIDVFLDRHIPILLLLALMLFLRIPNLVEPYWYGDESIYLTIGHAMTNGEKLYSQIIDHKTPLIYYLAMVPSQLWFRILNIGAMALSPIIFYNLSKKLFSRNSIAIFITFLFVLLTSFPGLEGNIPNGELFVMTFILIGAACLMNTRFFNHFFLSEQKIPGPELASLKTENFWLFAGGCFFGLGLLTKVPGLFDVAAFLSVGWFSFLRSMPVFNRFNKNRTWMVKSRESIVSTGIVVAGVLLPILLSIFYFVLRGSGKAYLDYGLLYNFRYAGSWKLDFANPILLFTFSLVGKVSITAAILLFLSLFSRYVRHTFQFIATWFCLALFATLLSNRPYPHYFLQLVPPFTLLIGSLLSLCREMIFPQKVKMELGQKIGRVLELFTSVSLIFILISTVVLLNVRLYATFSYYQRFYQLLTKQISAETYRNSFDSLMPDNYEAARLISSAPGDRLFIWGTDPGLYALSKRSPVGRFTVLFHIKDFKAEHETYLDFVREEPVYAVIMKTEEVPDEIRERLNSHYLPNSTFQHFILWKKISS